MKHTYTNTPFYILLYFLIVVVLFMVVPVSAQSDRLLQARQWSYEGQYLAADSLFHLILEADPAHAEARIGSAYNHSWNRNLLQAQMEFEHILRENPDNIPALVGLGYTLAWMEDYANAKYPFLRVLSGQPQDIEAKKGLAYVYLWQGASKVAIDMFESLRDREPSNPEFYIALAHAHLQRHETIEARRLVDHAIGVDPAYQAAHELRSAIGYATPFMEVDVWGGYSRIESMSRFGLRGLQLSSQLNPSFRALLSYDNSMSLENFFFADQRLQAETFLAGGTFTWNKRLSSRIQTGWRSLQTLGTQWLAIGEQAVLFKDGKILKAGGLLAAGNQLPDEWMLYTGISLPVRENFRMEPIYYVSQRGAGQDLQHRLALNTQWLSSSGLQAGAGAHFGNVNGSPETGKANTYGFHVSALLPLHHMVWLGATIRHEHSITGDYQTALLGIKLRFEK